MAEITLKCSQRDQKHKSKYVEIKAIETSKQIKSDVDLTNIFK